MGPETAYAQPRRQGQPVGQAGRSFRKTALGRKANLCLRVSWAQEHVRSWVRKNSARRSQVVRLFEFA